VEGAALGTTGEADGVGDEVGVGDCANATPIAKAIETPKVAAASPAFLIIHITPSFMILIIFGYIQIKIL
jgi:hypothetical protein